MIRQNKEVGRLKNLITKVRNKEIPAEEFEANLSPCAPDLIESAVQQMDLNVTEEWLKLCLKILPLTTSGKNANLLLRHLLNNAAIWIAECEDVATRKPVMENISLKEAQNIVAVFIPSVRQKFCQSTTLKKFLSQRHGTFH